MADITTYPGGKARLYQWLINQIPPHTAFISTHLGNCAIMRYKRPAKLNIGIDLDPAVIEMWIRRADPAGSIDSTDGGAAASESTRVATLAAAIDGSGEVSSHRHEHRYTPAPTAIPNEATRYKYLHTDCVPWLRSYPFTGSEFVYADPPYLFHTRKQKDKLYNFEYTFLQHIELLDALKRLPCPVMISGYQSEIYDDILTGWHKNTIQTTTRGNSVATEVIWMNYPQPTALHDYRYLGEGYRERERIKRKKQRWSTRWRVGTPGHLSSDSGGSIVLVLSIFPGIDMLGKGFEMEGFCVVRGPDLIWGGDIRSFHVPSGKLDGVIGGPPCQDFSNARRSAPTGQGLAMLNEFQRIVLEASPQWWLLENVERVPDVTIPGYTTQRFDLNARECGMIQHRRRHFQFGSPINRPLTVIPQRTSPPAQSQPTCLATEGNKSNRRTWSDFCELQGLHRDFDLPGLSIEAKYRAVGNGVPIPMSRTVASAIREAVNAPGSKSSAQSRLCACGCGRLLTGQRSDQKSATPACRKRLEKRR